MLPNCRCTFSTSKNDGNYIRVRTIDGGSSSIPPTFSTKQHSSSSTIEHKNLNMNNKDTKHYDTKTFKELFKFPKIRSTK
jgi:hypothetical protein